MTRQEAIQKVIDINTTLRERGMCWEEIEAFWQDCLYTAQAIKQLQFISKLTD